MGVGCRKWHVVMGVVLWWYSFGWSEISDVRSARFFGFFGLNGGCSPFFVKLQGLWGGYAVTHSTPSLDSQTKYVLHLHTTPSLCFYSVEVWEYPKTFYWPPHQLYHNELHNDEHHTNTKQPAKVCATPPYDTPNVTLTSIGVGNCPRRATNPCITYTMMEPAITHFTAMPNKETTYVIRRYTTLPLWLWSVHETDVIQDRCGNIPKNTTNPRTTYTMMDYAITHITPTPVNKAKSFLHPHSTLPLWLYSV